GGRRRPGPPRRPGRALRRRRGGVARRRPRGRGRGPLPRARRAGGPRPGPGSHGGTPVTGDVAGAVADWAEAELGLDLCRPSRASALTSAARVLHAAGVASPGSFTATLARSPSLQAELIAAVTVGETHFFREPPQYELVRREVLPRLVAR